MSAAEVAIYPPVLSADGAGDPTGWVRARRDELHAAINVHGAVLVRGLGLSDVDSVAAASTAALGPLMAELESFAPRTGLGAGLYSSTVWPPDQPMCMHHELSYAATMPGLLAFACLIAPEEGGITALADATAVLADLPPDLVARFEKLGWELVRTHNDVVGVPWREAFGTDDPAQVERYCRAHDIGYRWDDDGGLHTRRRLPAVVRHPVSGARVWCNQIAFLNAWTMDPMVRDYLVAEFGDDGLPFNTRYGDGQPIDAATIEVINDVYTRHTVREPWQAGDLLLVDNVRMAHSRESYRGSREIAVAMGVPMSLVTLAR